jgi:hypothetical protein
MYCMPKYLYLIYLKYPIKSLKRERERFLHVVYSKGFMDLDGEFCKFLAFITRQTTASLVSSQEGMLSR